MPDLDAVEAGVWERMGHAALLSKVLLLDPWWRAQGCGHGLVLRREPVGLLLEHFCCLDSLHVVVQGGHWGSWGLGRGSGFVMSRVASVHPRISTSSFAILGTFISMAVHSEGSKETSLG